MYTIFYHNCYDIFSKEEFQPLTYSWMLNHFPKNTLHFIQKYDAIFNYVVCSDMTLSQIKGILFASTLKEMFNYYNKSFFINMVDCDKSIYKYKYTFSFNKGFMEYNNLNNDFHRIREILNKNNEIHNNEILFVYKVLADKFIAYIDNCSTTSLYTDFDVREI